MINVPEKLKQAASEALARHREAPVITGVYGVSTAKSLASGAVPPETVARMHRFFASTQKLYEALTDEHRTFNGNEVVRSWQLNGDYLGRAFAQAHFARLVEAGLVPEDPELELYSMQPEEIYEAFLLGAWQYEYNLDSVQKAARFVEDYTRKTGNVLELPRAFGDSARAVANVLMRRFHAPSPFDIAKRELFGESTYLTIATYDPSLLRFTPYFNPSEKTLDEAAAQYLIEDVKRMPPPASVTQLPSGRLLAPGICLDGGRGVLQVAALFEDGPTRWVALRLCSEDVFRFVESDLVFDAIRAGDLRYLDEATASEFLSVWDQHKGYGKSKGNLPKQKEKLVKALIRLAKRHGWNWGFGDDWRTRGYPVVVYFDTPYGQVSFHLSKQFPGLKPGYNCKGGEDTRRMLKTSLPRSLKLGVLIRKTEPHLNNYVKWGWMTQLEKEKLRSIPVEKAVHFIQSRIEQHCGPTEKILGLGMAYPYKGKWSGVKGETLRVIRKLEQKYNLPELSVD